MIDNSHNILDIKKVTIFFIEKRIVIASNGQHREGNSKEIVVYRSKDTKYKPIIIKSGTRKTIQC